jgi:hypothetical protein
MEEVERRRKPKSRDMVREIKEQVFCNSLLLAMADSNPWLYSEA